MLPQLLGTFADANMHEFLLRRILLTLKIPPRLLHLIGQLLAKERHVDSWYGFAQRYCYWRGVKSAIKDRETWQRLVHGTTILLYHSVGWPEESVGRYITESRRFRWQMALLNWLRYRVLSMEEYLRYRIEHQLPPSRSILITFDDGYADNYALAYPILRRHGFAATIFLVSRFLGSTNQWDKQGELSGRPLLAKSEVQEMQDGGLQFGAHSRTHALLTELSPELVCDEVIGSRNDLQADLGSRLLAFAYPYGEYNVATQATLEKAGFRAGLTAQSGMNTLNTPLHALRRTEVYGTDSLLNFMLALWTGHTRKVFRSRDN
jgi:peptidoglycan/xylan/chitin deacetylase (PgdA/CDA1 family)